LRTDIHTDRQTNTLIAILRTHTGAEYNNNNNYYYYYYYCHFAAICPGLPG